MDDVVDALLKMRLSLPFHFSRNLQIKREQITPVGSLFGGFSAFASSMYLPYCPSRNDLAGTNVSFDFRSAVRVDQTLIFSSQVENKQAEGRVEGEISITACSSLVFPVMTNADPKVFEFAGRDCKLDTNQVQYSVDHNDTSLTMLWFQVVCLADLGTWFLGQESFPTAFFVTRHLEINLKSHPNGKKIVLKLSEVTTRSTSVKITARAISDDRDIGTFRAVLVNTNRETGKKEPLPNT